MNKKTIFTTILWIVCLCLNIQTKAQERVFAGYFDIPINSPEGTEVIGRIHLERNKDVHTCPIPEGYHFEILEQDDDALFKLETRYDLSKRIMGVFTVAEGKNTGPEKSSHLMQVALKDGDHTIKKFKVNIRVTKQTLWDLLNKRYTPQVIKNDRMYGRIKYKDSKVAELIEELKANEWRFKGLEKCYEGRPQDYVFKLEDALNDHSPSGTIEYDWVKVVNKIGGLGYSYATSKVYGPKGDPIKREELRETLYQAIIKYTRSVPIEGDEVMIDGKPIGNCTGDGFALLQAHKLAGNQTPTHQWSMTDGLMVPVLNLMPDIIKGMQEGDDTCIQVHDALVRYLQLFFAEIKSRRSIDNPNERWGELQDTIYSSGAWADANLGHRSRTMLAIPIIWADYNRPLTYVQYWYEDFYKGKPFKGFSYSTGWTPHGAVADVSYWMTKYNIPAHKYIQSGFQPDGTVSHHISNATDAAMVAYGFEWLTDCNSGYAYLKDTKFKVPAKYYQFQLDRLVNVYPHLFYKNRMDFLVSGRSFLEDMQRFVVKTYRGAASSLLKSRSKDTRLKGVDELKNIVKALEENNYEYSGTDAYWVNEYLVHRRGKDEAPFYASLKLKSERTVGAEDFSKKVRRSWYMGYGILPVKVDGEEYSDKVLRNYDWHALPGLTEEWRTDAMPTGHAQLSLPGKNKISGVLADGKMGMGIYHHLTGETYSSATAFKTYHFIEDKIISIGTGIGRVRDGQGEPVVTFVDQTVLNTPLIWCIGNEIKRVEPDQDVNLSTDIEGVCWLHQGKKGYVIIPEGKLQLLIRSGKEINVTDRSIAQGRPGFIIALSHGVEPGKELSNAYRYVQLPNVTAEEMPQRVKELMEDLEFTVQESTAHAIYSEKDCTRQYAFFKPAAIKVGDIEVKADDVAQLMLREEDKQWVLSVNNPMPDGKKQTMTFHISEKLPEGTYTYRARGVYPLEGETVTVTPEGNGCEVTVELPDNRDAERYNYQSDLYAATPILVNIPK